MHSEVAQDNGDADAMAVMLLRRRADIIAHGRTMRGESTVAAVDCPNAQRPSQAARGDAWQIHRRES